VRRLKRWLKGKRDMAADALLFPVSAKIPGGTERRTADMMRADLLAAKRKWIDEADDAAERRRRRKSDFLEYEDDNNRFADFQPRAAAGGGACARRFNPAPSGSSNRPPGLPARHTFITNLERAGVSPRTAQTLARHSDIRLTMGIYTHIELGDQAAAIAALPGPGAG